MLMYYVVLPLSRPMSSKAARSTDLASIYNIKGCSWRFHGAALAASQALLPLPRSSKQLRLLIGAVAYPDK